MQSAPCLLPCTCSHLSTRSSQPPSPSINSTSSHPRKSWTVLGLCSSSPTPALSVIPQSPATQACNVMKAWNKTKCNFLPLLFPSWVSISLGIPWFSSIAVFEGKEEQQSQTQRTEGRDGVPAETWWATWDFFSPLSMDRGVSSESSGDMPNLAKGSNQAKQISPGYTQTQLLSTSSIWTCNWSHRVVIFSRNIPHVTPVLKHRPKDALHLVGGSSHMDPTLLGSVWNCSSTVFEEDREIALSVFKNIFSEDITAGSKKRESVPFVSTIQQHQSQPSSWQLFEIQCLRPLH